MIRSRKSLVEVRSRYIRWLMLILTAISVWGLSSNQAEARRGLFRRGCGHGSRCCDCRSCPSDCPMRDIFCPVEFGGVEGEQYLYWGKRLVSDGDCRKPVVPMHFDTQIPYGCYYSGNCSEPGFARKGLCSKGYKKDAKPHATVVMNAGPPIKRTFDVAGGGTISLELYVVTVKALPDKPLAYVGYERAEGQAASDFPASTGKERYMPSSEFCGTIVVEEQTYYVIRRRKI